MNLSEQDQVDKSIIDSLAKFYESNPKAKKIAKRANDRSKFLAASYSINGPNIFIDKYLRSFLSEYNSRLFNGNGDKQPNSFNVMNSFVEPDEKALVLRLLPESHYSLSLNLILDSLTDPASGFSLKSLISGTDELNIYEYHVLGGYSEISLGHLQLTFHGIAFVRDGNELSIVAIFGKKVENLEERTIDEKMKFFPGKDFLGEIDSVDISDIEIVDGTNLVPIIILTRMTLSDERTQVRYILHEQKDTFDVLTNDPSVIEDMKIMGMGEEEIKLSLERLNEFLPIFEFVEQLPLFQMKIDELEDLSSIVRYPTGIKLDA